MTDVLPQRVEDVGKKLGLTDQEKFLYQLHLNNLWGDGGVDHSDTNPPSRSSLYQAVQEHEGKFYNIPTVSNGKIETEKYTKKDGTTMDVPNDKALQNVSTLGWDKFPSYATPQEADKRYDDMHQYMDEDTGHYFSITGDWN